MTPRVARLDFRSWESTPACRNRMWYRKGRNRKRITAWFQNGRSAGIPGRHLLNTGLAFHLLRDSSCETSDCLVDCAQRILVACPTGCNRQKEFAPKPCHLPDLDTTRAERLEQY